MTTERQSMIDLKALKKLYQEMELSNVAIIRFEYMLADQIIKIKHDHLLLKVSETCTIDHLVEQWIVRPNRNNVSIDKERECYKSNRCNCNPADEVP